MSEIVRNESVSTESLCTVIENDIGKRETLIEDLLQDTSEGVHKTNNNNIDNVEEIKQNGLEASTKAFHKPNGILSTNTLYKNKSTENCDTTTDTEQTIVSAKPRTKLKKSVSFDPNDEKIQKFIEGEPIIDQQNPFKHATLNGNAGKKKRTPPPVPTKRSTLSVKKTVTQQLREREREREREKEKERLKNEANKTKSQAKSPTSPDDFITTEEVLKQSKYVKTYIKNPDPFFVYDPTVLARIKFEELRELADKKQPKKLKLSNQTRERIKDAKSQKVAPTKSKLPTFKKCSKPNYPELSDIKVKVGTDTDGNYFNPAEVTKNAKKFDERVKKLHIDSDIDLDEIEEPLTKSESSDEVTVNSNSNNDTVDGALHSDDTSTHSVMNGFHFSQEHDTQKSTFTNTISSKEFQQYLEKKGLTLIPKKIPNGAHPMYSNGGSIRPNTHVSFRTDPEEHAKISINTMENDQQAKKPSVFQRLLSNSIFASRRNKTTPKETVPNPRSLYSSGSRLKNHNSIMAPTPIKRIVLERQSFHGRPRVGNLLSATEARDLQQQNERSRKSFASGDDLSISISSALTNAEYANDGEAKRLVNGSTGGTILRRNELRQPIAKPPRRTLSGDRLSNVQQLRATDQSDQRNSTIIKPRVQRPATNQLSKRSERIVDVTPNNNNSSHFRRTLERQSLIPKRSTQENDKRQVFGRSASMDRNEILKRTATRRLQNRSNSANESLKVPTNSKENLRADFTVHNGPKITSTPRQDSAFNKIETYVPPTERKIFSPALINSAKPTNVYVDQQEWERLRAIKERTDRELYYKVLQQQQQQQQQQQLLQQHQKRLSDPESIYERLKPNQVIIHEPPMEDHSNIPNGVIDNNNFVRGSPQRNTFSGVIRNRQVKIIDGRTVVAPDQIDVAISQQEPQEQHQQQQAPRSQSVLDNMTIPNRVYRRGYESDNETPVVLRRKGPLLSTDQPTPQRRIGGLLTREEILQKVKEFCRKSLNKTPTVQQPQIQAIYETQPALSTDISPVSYASVETHHPRTNSRIYAAPQVPQRMQSLPQQFVPITQEALNDSTSSPIYAHVIKRSSIQSNQSELYDHPHRPMFVRRESDTQGIYVRRPVNVSGGTLQRGSNNELLVPTQYIVVDSDKLTAAPTQVLNYYAPQQQVEVYAQPQYVRPHQLQPMPGSYGYITVREPMYQPQQTVTRQAVRLLDGRSTPLILESSSSPQQVSQIYWTPQHQRLQQQAGLLPVNFSPRYVIKQPYPVTTSRPDPQYQQQLLSRVTKSGIVQEPINIQEVPQQLREANTKNFTPILRTNTPTKHFSSNGSERSASVPVSQSRQFSTIQISKPDNNQNTQHAFDWESGSEAGEVQRIMERQRDSGGESKVNSMLRNLKHKVSQFIRSSK